MAIAPLLLVALIILIVMACVAWVADRRQGQAGHDLDQSSPPVSGRSSPSAEEPFEHPDAAEPLRVPVQLLFAESRHNRLQIDCIVLEPVRRGSHVTDAGTPIVLKVRPLRTQELAPVVESLVAEWAEEGRIVSLEMDDRKPAPKLCLHSETSKIRFDVEDRGRDPITKRRWR